MSADEFLQDYSVLTSLYMEGRFAGAISLTERMEGRHPHRVSDIRHARTCLYAAAGGHGEALATMASVVDAGSWWSPDRLDDSDFHPIRDDERFGALAETMRARYDRAVHQARLSDTRVDLLGATSSSDAAIVALHMYGATGAMTASTWQPVSDRFVVAVPESPLRNGDGQPCWDDRAVADRAVEQAVQVLRDHASGLPIVIAGASQGARHAGRLALTGHIPGCVGCLCIVGAPPVDEVDGELRVADQGAVRAWFIAGELDELTAPRQRAVHEHLQQAGVASQLVVVAGLGHTYPPDFPGTIGPAMEFLLR